MLGVTSSCLKSKGNMSLTRIIGNLIANWRIAFTSYSGTNRLGDLYEKELFARVKDDGGGKSRWLNELFIYPTDAGGKADLAFKPKYGNWSRRAKVPILILNATTLNTGHNWQFTASWMGEPPSGLQKIDANYRLRRTYYKSGSADGTDRKVRLGQAVAASSCVPGMFSPLVLKGYYEGKTVKLVDGGVHDNQGLCGLLDQDCAVLLVSDASGQMSEMDQPRGSLLPVMLRTNDALMERARNAQHQDLLTRQRSGSLQSLMFIHLKLGLDAPAIDWVNCDSPGVGTEPGSSAKVTAYHIRKDVQRKISAIRTDLDSFNDAEAFTLMTSGYQMTEAMFPKLLNGFRPEPVNGTAWGFLKVATELSRVDAHLPMLRLLDISHEKFFKIWRLVPELRWMIGIPSLLLIVAGIFFCWDFFHGWIEMGGIAALILGAVLSLQLLLSTLSVKVNMVKMLSLFIVLTLVWIPAQVHLLIFDRWYLHRGKR